MRDVTNGAVVSRDGTTIGYRQVGSGPGLVVVHGTMSSGYNHIELAEALADEFTVFLPDRRGRGLSGPYAPRPFIHQEIEDLGALLSATGARSVFGVSVGAIIALEAALELGTIDRLALYEPPFFVNGPAPTAWLTRFDREIADGRVASALVTGMKASGLGPPMLNVIPHWLLARMTGLMLSREKSGAGEYVPMRDLAPTLHHDGHMIAEANERLERFRALAVEVLLLGGSKSPAYMKSALARLEVTLPDNRRVELRGLDHAASWNRDRRGRPGPVADALRSFFHAPVASMVAASAP